MFRLRRRKPDGSRAEASPEEIPPEEIPPEEFPVEEIPPEEGEDVLLVPVSKLKALTRKKSKRRNGLIFGLGGLFGIIVAVFFANQSDVINFEGLMDLNLDSLLDVIPAGIIRDAKELTVRSSATTKAWKTERALKLIIQTFLAT